MGKLALARDSQPAKIVLPNFGRSHSDVTTRFDCFPMPAGSRATRSTRSAGRSTMRVSRERIAPWQTKSRRFQSTTRGCLHGGSFNFAQSDGDLSASEPSTRESFQFNRLSR